MKLITLILYFSSITFTLSFLKKYGTDTTTEDFIIFEAKEFKDGEEMHFKIKTHDDNYEFEYVEYQYLDNNFDLSNEGPFKAHFKANIHRETQEIHTYITRYFTIKKDKKQFGNSNGDYLTIMFLLKDGASVEITNTKEDEGKLETWVIIVIVVVIVIIVAGFIIFCICRRIRARKAMATTNPAATNYGAQVYDAQVYQAQMNQAQYPQQQNDQTPYIENNIGYTSNAMAVPA